MPKLTTYEQEHWDKRCLVVGIDEAGRGPMAGPLAVGAVIINPEDIPDAVDSKTISEAKRVQLAAVIRDKAFSWGVGLVSAQDIDQSGISKALHTASQMAWEDLVQRFPKHCEGDMQVFGATLADWKTRLASEPSCVAMLIDGPNDLCPWFGGSKTFIVKGDSLSRSISAASILAKTTRDEIMIAADATYPEYGFARHKGYGSQAHMQAIEEHGPTPLHRLSFGKLKRYLPKEKQVGQQLTLWD